MNFLEASLPEAFWARVSPCPVTGCWLWTGSTNKNGYGAHGRPAAHSGSKLTHRFTYETAIGALPAGTELDHRVCKTRSCCNPHHLEAVSHRVNVQRGDAKKSHCVRGHELSDANMMIANGNSRRCIECYRMHADERRRKQREATLAKPPREPKPKKLEGLCGWGHAMTHNGKRLVCKACGRSRGNDRRPDPGGTPLETAPL